MIRIDNLIIFTSILLIFAAGLFWLFTAMGVPNPYNIIASAIASIAFAMNL